MRLAHDDQVGVVDDELARRAQMDDSLGRGRGFFERVDVRHHVMAQAFFPTAGRLEVYVIERGLHLFQRVFADAHEPELALAACEFEPEAAPQAELMAGREDTEHRPARVACGEGGFVGVG